jgi:hypothetical protein
VTFAPEGVARGSFCLSIAFGEPNTNSFVSTADNLIETSGL